MKIIKTTFLILVIIAPVIISSCRNGKYCVGGKRKYKQMKRDHPEMVF